MLKNYKKYSQILTHNIENGAAQAMLYSLGLNNKDFNKVQAGIGSVWYESNPCNAKLNILSNKVKQNLNNSMF